MNSKTLKQRFLHAVSWSLVGYAASQVLRLGSNLLLTRMLAPELFGVMSVGYMVIVGLSMFSDIGLGPGIIQSQRGEEEDYLNVCWTIQVMRGVVITSISLLIAGALHFYQTHWSGPNSTSVYSDARLPAAIAGLSIIGMIYGLESTNVWLARRKMAMRRLTELELTSTVVATAVTLIWANRTGSIWALVSGWIAGAFVKMVMTHFMLPGFKNKFYWEKSAASEIINFGKWAFLSSILSFLLNSSDRILLGGLLDSKTMGLYSIAFLLINSLQAALSKVETYAILPALGEVVRDQPATLRSTLYKVRLPVDAICLICSGALFMLGENIVSILYDVRYKGAGVMLSILSLTLFSTRLDFLDQCLLSLGKPRTLSTVNLFRLGILYIIVLGAYLIHGSSGVVWGVGVSALCSMLVVIFTQKSLGLVEVKREFIAIPLYAIGIAVGWLIKLTSETILKL